MGKLLNRSLILVGEKKKTGTPVVNQEVIDRFGMVVEASGATVPSDADAGYAVGARFRKTSGNSVGATLYINEGTTASADFNAVDSVAAGGISTWDALYDNDKTLSVDGATVTFAGTSSATDVFTLSKAGGAGNVLAISNSGTGKDILGTSSTWSVSKLGAAVFTAIAMLDNELITFGTGSDATIGWNGSVLNIAGVVDFDDNITTAANATITQAGVAGSTVFTITAGDAVMSDGSVAITDADNAATFSLTNATVTTANLVVITADASTSGDILYIDNGGASLTSGMFINLNDDDTMLWGVGADGATRIATTAATTHALHITGIQTSQTMVTIDNVSGVQASDTALLLLDAGGAVASGGNILRIAPTGTPNAGAIGIEFVGASKALNAMYIDADPTASDVVTFLGGGALTDNNAVLTVMSDGAIASGGNTFRVETAGTPASGAIYSEFNFTGITDTNENIGVKIDAGGKKVIGLHVDADPVANSAVYLTSGAALAADKATLEVVSVPTTNNADSAVVRLEQTHTAGGSNILHMVQLDVDKPFFGFETTVGTGNAVEAIASKTLTTTHFVMVDLEGVGVRYLPIGTIA